MLHLVSSNDFAQLLECWLDNVRATRRDQLETVEVAVPSPHLETFLKFGAARAERIAANIRARSFRALLGDLLEASSSDSPRLAHRAIVESALLSLLHDRARIEQEPFHELRQYLEAAGPHALDARRVQLARRLARLFEGYAEAYPELVEAWEDDRKHRPKQSDHRGIDAWQRELWRALFVGRGVTAKRQRPFVPLNRIPKILESRRIALPRTLHLFTLPPLGATFVRIVRALAEHTEVFLYRLRLRAKGGRALLGPVGEGMRASETLPPGLATKQHRERDREPPHDASLLHRVQRACEGEVPEKTGEGDRSTLRVLACSSIRREVEVIAQEILELLRQDDARPNGPPLRFGDIAILVPQALRRAYHAQVAAVFRDSMELAYHLLEQPVTEAHPLVSALELLLALPLGRFTRPELVRLLSHPALAGHFAPDAPPDGAALGARIGAVRGRDRDDHAGTYIERDVLSWDQGLTRLALGIFMPNDGTGRSVSLGEQAYLPAHIATHALPGAMRFSVLARSLIRDARFAAGASFTLPEWGRFFESYATSYIVPRSDQDEQDERILLRCMRALSDLAPELAGDAKLSYRVACTLARARLAALVSRDRPYFAGGIVVSTLQALRGVPFRVLFVAGLGARDFPTREPRDRLDLGHPGADGVGAREEAALAEALQATRDRVTLSYVARDEATGDALEPCAWVRELLAGLERTGLVGAAEVPFHTVALRRHEDPQALALGLRGARTEARARRLGRELRAFTGRRLLETSAFEAELSTPARDAIASELALLSAAGALETRREFGDGPASVPIIALRRFLECPLQGSARYVLGLRDPDSGSDGDEEEPFAIPRRNERWFLRQVFLSAICDGKPGEEALERTYEREATRAELEGTFPTGFFARVQSRRHREVLRAWTRALAPHLGTSIGAFQLGSGTRRERFVRLEPAPTLLVPRSPPARGPLSVRLIGTTEPRLGASFVTLIERPRESGAALLTRTRKEGLRAFLDSLVLRAAGLGTTAHDALIVWADQEAPTRLRMDPVSAEAARSYLIDLVADLIAGMHPYLLPCEAVFDRTEIPLAARVQRLRESDRYYSSRYGPLRHAERFAPLDEITAEATLRRRFGLYFDTVHETGA